MSHSEGRSILSSVQKNTPFRSNAANLAYTYTPRRRLLGCVYTYIHRNSVRRIRRSQTTPEALKQSPKQRKELRGRNMNWRTPCGTEVAVAARGAQWTRDAYIIHAAALSNVFLGDWEYALQNSTRGEPRQLSPAHTIIH